MRRRTILQALSSLPFALPLLDITRESRAASPDAKRLVLVNTPNGLITEQLFPESGLFERGEKNFGSGEDEVDLAAGYTLASLADLQSELLLVTGLDFPGVEEHGFHPIMAGTHSKLETSGFDTIDQVAATLLGGSTPLSSINLGVPENSGDKAGRVDSASGKDGRPIPFHQTPQDAFEALFENFAVEADEEEEDPQVEDRRKVLDLMQVRLESLHSGLGSADARRVEWHMDALADLERSLTAMGATAACMPPDMAEVTDDTPAITDFMIKLTVQGLACGLTNVVNFSFGGSAADSVYSWLSGTWPSTSGTSEDDSASEIRDSHHAISHNAGIAGTRDRRKGGMKAAIDRWHAEQFGALLRALKAVEMPGGETLFDSTTSIWMGENRDGTHTRHDLHFLIGGHGTGFRMGRILRLSDKPRTDWDGEHPEDYSGTFGNNFWLTLLRSFGSDASSFGDQDWVSGEIAELS